MKTKNKFIIIALICLITISSVWAGRTYAYFNANSNASGTITMGTLKIDSLKTKDNAEINWNIDGVVPNQEFGGSYKAVVDSDINYYTRILFKATVTPKTIKEHSTNCADHVDNDIDILSIAVSGSGSTYEEYGKDDDGFTIYYKMSPTTPNENSTTDENFNINLKVHDWVGNGGCDYYMGATITLNMQVEVIQADYLESNTTGTSYTDVTALHNKWTKRTSIVTLTMCGFNSGFYYAIDGENELHTLSAGETIELSVNSKIFIATSKSYLPDDYWDIEENVMFVEKNDYGSYTYPTANINRVSTYGLENNINSSVSSSLKKDDYNNVGGTSRSWGASISINGTVAGGLSYDDIHYLSMFCLLPIYEDTIIYTDVGC